MSNKSKVAIVTGAGRYRGIGRSTALVLAKKGINVIVTGTGRSPETFPDDEKKMKWNDVFSTSEEISNLGVKSSAYITDVSDENSVKKMVNNVIEEYGQIDILVNNAAAPNGADRVSVIDLDDTLFRNVINVKLFGTFYCSKYVIREMIKKGNRGRIINISYVMGKSGRANTSAYNAANFAIDGFSQALAKEVAKHNITVNTICPGLIDTARMDLLGRDSGWKKRLEEIPLGRAGTHEEVGELIGFICQKEADYITGQAININGGTLTER